MPSSLPKFNGDKNANRSKVYQYGFRNPFRITAHPATGEVYVGEVGRIVWEEVNFGKPGANFGWPFFGGGRNHNGRYICHGCRERSSNLARI